MSDIYTLEEVARHNHENDLWMILHGSVYNLTSFYKKHPGGEEVLLDLAGGDGTTCFDNIGHSHEAKMLREQFKIGELIEDDAGAGDNTKKDESSRDANSTDDDNWDYVPPSKDERSPMIFIIGFLVYAVIIYYIWLR
ncbi:cytochrome b5-like [Pseudomyrmex gracilis]|uniref:cytochrome b5-like n=1 Tax=Pseudomyrmex gracilis TaxID=219809 RepID=UPI00099508D9|nr:cytochrome b5-like [Pseudomyrmex gracilis]XP_020286090.1 cytochrome b5-like [Pseudomyrmex gracilis]